MREHADRTGAQFAEGRVCRVQKEKDGYVVFTEEEQYRTRGVIVASGARHRKLGVPGEEEFCGMGVSYCATCDGAFFRNKTTAVVGGGDVALEDAIFLARMCEKVYVIHRRDAFRGAKILQERLMALENVEILWDSVVEEIHGDEMVQSISISNKKSGEKSEIQVQGVFIAVGIVPCTEGFDKLADMDDSGYFEAGEDCRTSEKMLYAAGDVRTKQLRQVVTAAADGANAVASLQEDLLAGSR